MDARKGVITHSHAKKRHIKVSERGGGACHVHVLSLHILLIPDRNMLLWVSLCAEGGDNTLSLFSPFACQWLVCSVCLFFFSIQVYAWAYGHKCGNDPLRKVGSEDVCVYVCVEEGQADANNRKRSDCL
ncbi:hypothetical protein, unlikely [Trypanosoma brucei gambiense DAL972]|uniref:Uncharacterized protein n=1 Tax=Trypanosoma brucei gambiense (strain MHOM/CI/86/DAL972) TaxID=679716 RepID=C9ZKB1_TRYB9|nr:hypothetical protein, unlikely [Trypanosoma brucei gambiense DAL972]CBH09875.1 hypothetical protein, unlikely [Trypanosoma brucei gambiense DAL972]|eukprot:XP_011772168.1 hypothetical protein, unlikely [Trypanosoma brucei gambiense DAL972]